MNNQPFTSLLAGFLQLIVDIVSTLLPRELAYHSMSSVSWNG